MLDICNWNTAATSCVWLEVRGQNKNNHTVPILVFIILYERVCSIYSCRLEPLTSMRECKLTALFWRCFLTSRRPCASLNIHVCSKRLTRLWAITREQPNIFVARIINILLVSSNRAEYEGCSNMNASSFIAFFTYMLRQNVIPFWKELFVAFKMAPNTKKHSLYVSSYGRLYHGNSSILKLF